VKNVTGESMRGYGRGAGDSRRYFIDSRKYTADDGSQRFRVRFYVEGNKGKCTVWAEVSDRMANNEFVYIICQVN
jgi:hypothetical protein